MAPEGWRSIALGEAAESITVGHVGSTSEHYTEPSQGVLFLRTGNVASGKLLLNDIKYVTRDFHDRLVKSSIRPGDVLISRVGQTGNAALVPVGFPEANCANIIIIRPGTTVTSEFLKAYINGPVAARQNQGLTAGSVQAVLNIGAIKKLDVLLPPLGEQRKIAAILSSVDDAIEATQAIIDQLLVVKKAMMSELLTRGLPGRHTTFKQTEVGEVPDAWNVVRLASIATIVRGSTPRPAKDPRYFGGDAVPWITVGELSKDDWPYLVAVSSGLTEAGKERSRYLDAGSVVLSNSGFGCGVPKILKISGCANDGIAAFLDLTRLQPLFLYYTLFSMIDFLRGSVARGVDQPNLNTTLIGELVVRSPPPEEQQSIVDALWAIDVRLDTERKSMRGLSEIRVALMSLLLTGEVRVTPDEELNAA